MTELSDFDLGTWLDDAHVLVVQPKPSKVKRLVKRAVAAAAMGAGLLATYAAETHSALHERVAWTALGGGANASSAHLSTSLFSDQEKLAGWQAAIEFLRAAGEDVGALLRAGAVNVQRYGSREHAFPSVFPSDE